MEDSIVVRGKVRRRNLDVPILYRIAKNIVFAILGGVVISVLIEWVGMALDFWEQPGSLHAKGSLLNELRWLELTAYWWDPTSAVHLLQIYLAHLFVVVPVSLYEYALALYYILQTTFLRLVIVICSLPAVLMIWLLVLLDGLANRDLRRYQMLHESGFVYHKAKALFGVLFTIPLLIYLSFPSSFHPTLFLFCFACLPAVVIWIMASRFKKYV